MEGELAFVGAHGELEVGLVLYRPAHEGATRAHSTEGHSGRVQDANVRHTDERVLEACLHQAPRRPAREKSMAQVKLDEQVQAHVATLLLVHFRFDPIKRLGEVLVGPVGEPRDHRRREIGEGVECPRLWQVAAHVHHHRYP